MAFLVLGYRKSFLKTLISEPRVYLWVDDLEYRKKTWMPKSWKLIRAPYPRSHADLNKIGWTRHGRPQKICGTTEATVMAAALADAYLLKKDYSLSALKGAVALHDKYHMKTRAQRHGIRVIPWAWTGSRTKCEWFLRQMAPHTAIVIKARNQSGSRNQQITTCKDYVHQSNKLIELFLNAREYSIEMLTVEGRVILKNITECRIKKHLNVAPAPLSAALTLKIHAFHARILRAFDIKNSFTQVKIYLDARENLFFGRIALRAPGAHLMELLSLVYEVNAWSLVAHAACLPVPSPHLQPTSVAAAWMIHPGPGKIRAVRGQAATQNLPACVDLKLDAHVGDWTFERTRLSQAIGHLILKTDTHEQLNIAIDQALKTLQIELELDE